MVIWPGKCTGENSNLKWSKKIKIFSKKFTIFLVFRYWMNFRNLIIFQAAEMRVEKTGCISILWKCRRSFQILLISFLRLTFFNTTCKDIFSKNDEFFYMIFLGWILRVIRKMRRNQWCGFTSLEHRLGGGGFRCLINMINSKNKKGLFRNISGILIW